MFKWLLSGMAAASLVATPTLAQASADPASIARASAEQTAGNDLRGPDGEMRPWVIGVAAIGVILGILAVSETWPFDDDEDEPVSP